MDVTDNPLSQSLPPTSPAADADGPLVSIVVPARDEAENVPLLVDRLRDTITRFTERFEIIFVCDGFDDSTGEAVGELRAADGRVKLLRLSRSFGHQNALLAGLDHASGQVVVTMDADQQHPPETVADLLLEWEKGYDVVHAIRRPTRRQATLIRKCRSLAYTMLRRLCEVDIVPQSADFKLYDRSAVTALCQLREHGRFNRGLARWIGFRHAAVHYDEALRQRGRPSYSFARRLLLLMNGIFSLSSRPLQYLGVVGLGLSALSGLYLMVILIGWALDVEAYRLVAGWASTVGIVLLVGGVQLTGLWLMGQYIARTYDEVKGRPCYIVADAQGLRLPASPAGDARQHVLPRRADRAAPPGRDPAEDRAQKLRRIPSLVADELHRAGAPLGQSVPPSPEAVERELQTCDHS
ncbi:MAG TPA: glycosyltransferase family 2 protein [Phycisphaerae bacterium]|nr:glycosyltransferase family 2 protein [Phycisphaerae bacterium]